MANPLEITSDDITKLSDADLRALIGRLCEEDYRMAGLPTKGITWGGHQDAQDGGFDVVVRDDVMPPKDSPIQRTVTGFQVKKPNMTPSKIKDEMCPKGELRQCIKGLIRDNGSYIIVSSGTSATASALKDRFNAMREAVSTEDNNENLHLDFFDRGRVATWVRSHPLLVQWILEKIGRQSKGWKPYSNWANPKAGIEEEYLLDEGLRLHDWIRHTDNGLSAKDGIQLLRSTLSSHGKSVRLAGLSGVGKTRLAQALFDDRIGKNALDPEFAFYTDVAFDPDPDPKSFAEQLIAARTRAVLIVDNCMPELHSELTKVCSVPESTVSLLTLEYDVREDLPEETSVFRLEPASDILIEKLVKNRFPHISQVAAGTIAEFSGGNARIAIALANTVDKGESLSGLNDANLFERLFEQRHGSDKELLMSARVCSLVYSFEGTDIESAESELNVLASLIGISGEKLYRDVATIKDRELIQSRDVWRAVLPQALANRLAKQALESIPPNKLTYAFLRGPERLIKSFSRRLGYLHKCKEVVNIVEDWLLPDSWLGEANCNFNELGMQVFRNIAPVSPEKSLDMMERAASRDDGDWFTSRQNNHHETFVRVLRLIAYDPKLFERSVELIHRFAISKKAGENNNSARDVLKSLFYIYLSGTHATVESRASVITNLVNSEDQAEQELGIDLLEATLEATHFTSGYEFDFGARSRDYGYRPRTFEEYDKWFGTFIVICTKVAISEKSIAGKARKVFSDKLGGLCYKIGIFDVLEEAALKIHKEHPWYEGWVAVKRMITLHRTDSSKEIFKRIQVLEERLRPDNHYDLVQAYVLSDEYIYFSLLDSDQDEADFHIRWEQVDETARMLGIKVAQEKDTFARLLPDLIAKYAPRVGIFGEGLAKGSTDRETLWQDMCAAFKKAESGHRDITLLRGFLSMCAELDPELHSSVLDSLIEEETFSEFFPLFQIASPLDKKGIERLIKSLDFSNAKTEHFRLLAGGRAHEPISDDDLAIILERILSKKDGIQIALHILAMRFHEKKAPTDYSERLKTVARDTLCLYAFPKERVRCEIKDLELSQLSKVGLVGKDGVSAAHKTCQHLAQALMDKNVDFHDYLTLMGSIAHVQPFIFLEEFIGNDEVIENIRFFYENYGNRVHPLEYISDDDIISWCEKEPVKRYPRLASSMHLFKEVDSELVWKPILYLILDKAPELDIIFHIISDSMKPGSWIEPRADIMGRRLKLLMSLFQHENADICTLAKSEYIELEKDIKEWRKSVGKKFRTRFESFE